MADTVANPGDRGTLVVKDKVVERLATKAALDTDGVLPRSTGLDKITGRALPRVRVRIAGDRVRAGIDIATRWPTPLSDVTSAVRTNVARAITDYAGLHVDGIDIDVPAVLVDPAVVPTASERGVPGQPAPTDTEAPEGETSL